MKKNKITPWTMFKAKVSWSSVALLTALYFVISIIWAFAADKTTLKWQLAAISFVYGVFLCLPLASIYLNCYETWCRREVSKDRQLYDKDFEKIEKHLEQHGNNPEFWEQFCERHGYHPENAMRQYRKSIYKKYNPE